MVEDSWIALGWGLAAQGPNHVIIGLEFSAPFPIMSLNLGTKQDAKFIMVAGCPITFSARDGTKTDNL